MHRSGIVLFFYLICISGYSQVQFIVESVPSSTQSSDTIFITGTFNNWTPNDPRYALRRQLNGQLALTVNLTGHHEYKFTRGSWTKVETNSANQYNANRVINANTPQVVFVSIANWLDQGGARDFNYGIFFFFACAFQGIALCFLVYRSHKKDKSKFASFLAFNITLIVLFLLIVFQQTTNQIWQSYITFLFHIALFLWAPLAISFTDSTGPNNFKIRLSHFLPAMLILIFIVCRLMNPAWLQAMSGYIAPALSGMNASIIVAGIFFTASMWIRYLIKHASIILYRSEEKYTFYRLLVWSTSVPIIFLIINTFALYFGMTGNFVEDFLIVAVAFSPIAFLETWFYWRYPELIREDKQQPVHTENYSEFARKLQEMMETKKPYKNVELTISDLAELAGMKPHQLSRVINDHYQKNFRDFVNSFRIREFIELANSKEYGHYTFLALAQEVGFNSKSTFNLAFKKQTNLSPREYFKKSHTAAADAD